MNSLVRILVNQDGEAEIGEFNRGWHLIIHASGDPALFCTGEFFIHGTSYDDTVYELKKVKRGGITCELCLAAIKEIKNVKL